MLQAFLIAAALFLPLCWMLRLIFFRGPLLPPSENSSQVIIDMHCHCAGIGAGDSGCFVSAAMQKSWKYKLYFAGFNISEKELESHGDQVDIEK